MCVYIPTNDVLFKLMRATIGVDKVEDIWIFNEGYQSFNNAEVKMNDLSDLIH